MAFAYGKVSAFTLQERPQGSGKINRLLLANWDSAARLRRVLALLAACLLAGLLSACGSQQKSSQSVPSSADALDPGLRQVYETLGGEPLLGAVISGVFTEDGLTCQLALNAAVCIDPLASGLDRYVFAPLGQKAAAEYQSPDFPDLLAGREVNGIAIFPAFEPLFVSLYETRFAGAPVTAVLYNEKAQRLEQYFENVAMAANLDNPGHGYLLPLGHDACNGRCTADTPQLPGSAAPLTPLPPATIHPAFLPGIARMDGFKIIGNPLTQPYETGDGYVVQVFANVVVRAPLEQLGAMELMPIARQLEMTVMEPVRKQYDKPEGVVFYGDDEDALGYHVPIEFDQFIDQHGGRQTSGEPVAEVLFYEDGAIRQCFENYCLDYSPDPSDAQPVSLYPLGARYLQRALEQGLVNKGVALSELISMDGGPVRILLAEGNAQLPSGEMQTILIGVFNEADQTPIPDVGVRLKLILPDGSSQEFETLHTGAAGQVVVQVSGQQGLESGSLVVYQVCIDELPGDLAVCESDAYIVWDADG